MAYVDYSKVKASRNYGKSLAPTVTTPTFDSLPWAKANAVYLEAANNAAAMSIAAHNSARDEEYEKKISKLETDWEAENSESGSYEGNIRDEHPQKPYDLPDNLASVRRKAGQMALKTEFMEIYGLTDSAPILMPQIITHLSRCNLSKNENGLISGLQFCKDHFATPEGLGLYRMLMLDSRSSYLKTQYKAPNKQYCALVPLVLYAHKLTAGVPYSAWDPEEIHYVVNHSLAEAMKFRPENWPDKASILTGRTQGLTVASGASAGSLRSPVSTYKLYSTTGTCFQGMPADAQVILAQIWCAHPDNRTKYMILDCVNWDKIPMPLIAADVVPEATSKYLSSVELPTWG